MEKQELIDQLKNFLTTENACIQALECLNSKAEIGIEVAGSVELSVRHKNNQIVVEEKKAFGADFCFSASPEAVQVLIAEKGLSPAQLGIKLTKQVISGDVKITMPGSLLQIPQKGYLKILAVGGTEFLNELKKHNVASVPSILSALKKLRRQ